MKRFSGVLDDLNRRLDVPQPQKYRIIKEVADDLEDLYAYYIEQGVLPGEAEARAEEKLVADDETIRLLTRLNESSFNSLLRRFSRTVRLKSESQL